MKPNAEEILNRNSFDASFLKEMQEPRLLTSTKGVGRKIEIARQMDLFHTIGEDLVALIADELVTTGATPLFITSYLTMGSENLARVTEVISGIKKGSQRAGVTVLAQESVESRTLREESELLISGTATGVVDAEQALGPNRVEVGDVIIAMPASGFHSAGFALVNEIVATQELDLTKRYDFDTSLGQILLTPSEIYTLDCLALIKSQRENIRAFAHITSGGVAGSTAGVIPDGLTAIYDRSTWALPLEMKFLAGVGSLPQAEMEGRWNAGIGMSAIVDPAVADLIIRSLAARGMKAWIAGKVEKAEEMGAPRAYLVSDYL